MPWKDKKMKKLENMSGFALKEKLEASLTCLEVEMSERKIRKRLNLFYSFSNLIDRLKKFKKKLIKNSMK